MYVYVCVDSFMQETCTCTGGNKDTRLVRNIRQSIPQLFPVPLPAPHSQYLANVCDVFARLGTKRRMRNSAVTSADAAAAAVNPPHEYLGK